MQIETLSQMHSDNSLVELNIVMKKTSDHSPTTSPLFLFFNPQSEIRIPQLSTRWHVHLRDLATAIHEISGLNVACVPFTLVAHNWNFISQTIP